MTILIAGAAGFLGSSLLKFFSKNNYKVIGLKRTVSDSDRIDVYKDNVTLYDIDKTELTQIFQEQHVDIVINTVTNYGRKENSLISIVDTNLLFGLKLLEESLHRNVKMFINTDTLLDRNINSYALSKAQLVDWMKFLVTKNTKIINIKIEHMYGVGDDENKFIYWLINKLKNNQKEVDLTSGIQKRDFIYIDDVVKAYEVIIDNLDKISEFDEFEIGTGSSIEVKKIVQLIYGELQKKNTIKTQLNFGTITYRENENMDMKADISKLQSLGWSPSVAIEDGIKKIIEEED